MLFKHNNRLVINTHLTNLEGEKFSHKYNYNLLSYTK